MSTTSVIGTGNSFDAQENPGTGCTQYSRPRATNRVILGEEEGGGESESESEFIACLLQKNYAIPDAIPQ